VVAVLSPLRALLVRANPRMVAWQTEQGLTSDDQLWSHRSRLLVIFWRLFPRSNFVLAKRDVPAIIWCSSAVRAGGCALRLTFLCGQFEIAPSSSRLHCVSSRAIARGNAGSRFPWCDALC